MGSADVEPWLLGPMDAAQNYGQTDEEVFDRVGCRMQSSLIAQYLPISDVIKATQSILVGSNSNSWLTCSRLLLTSTNPPAS